MHASVSPSPPVTPTSTHRSVHYTTLAVMPTQPLCFGGTTDGTVHIWDVHTRELVRVLYGHVGAVTGLSLACDARTLVSSATDGTVLSAPYPKSVVLLFLVKEREWNFPPWSAVWHCRCLLM